MMHSERLVGTFLCILIRLELVDCISELKSGIVTAGVLGDMGNKGVRESLSCSWKINCKSGILDLYNPLIIPSV